MSETIHNDASSLREQYLEYGFLGELCREMWKRGIEMDILRSHTDRSGYDILLEANGIERHVQMKSSFIRAKTARQKINVRLAEKPSGCVIWVRFDPETLKLTEFLWFGASPGEPLPELGDKIGKHEKGDQHGFKAQRAAIRVINKGRFELVRSMPDLADRLFEPDLTYWRLWVLRPLHPDRGCQSLLTPARGHTKFKRIKIFNVP